MTDEPDKPQVAKPTVLSYDDQLVGFSFEKAGDVIGRYRLLKPIGEGGFGMVWRAEQHVPIHREVALKVIKPGMDSREVIARFEAERQALALMEHPNIAVVLDAGTTENGRPYFVMELVKGTAITAYCDLHKLTIRQRLEMFISVCHAVQHAHQKAILHRDLKPSNILVEEVDGKPQPKVIDFGIAKALRQTSEAALHASLARTAEGMFVGTPQYMSPEQAGTVPDVDSRSDIYSLGVILYELLTGDTPLGREELRMASFDEILRLIRESEPRRPSARFIPATELSKITAASRLSEPKKLCNSLRGDLDWIVMKALEKDRSRRYETANTLALDLQRHLNHEPVSAGPPSAAYRLIKLVRRNRMAFAAGAVILALLAAGIAVGKWQAGRVAHAETLLKQEHGGKTEAMKEADTEREKKDRLLWAASRDDHEAALRAFAQQHQSEGLAFLERALRHRPSNSAALATSATHALGMSTPQWRTVSVSAFKDAVNSLAFSPDGRWLAAGSQDNTARIIETATGRQVSQISFSDAVHSVSFSPDGTCFAATGEDHTLVVATTMTGKPLWKTSFGNTVLKVSFSPDGRLLGAASLDRTARIFDAESGKQISSVTFGSSVLSIGFSPDGKQLAAGSLDNTARIIEVATGKELGMTKFGATVMSVSFSPDGRRMAAGSGDKTARVIECETGREIFRAEFGQPVSEVQFSPDGLSIAALSWDKTLRFLEANTGREISRYVFGEATELVSLHSASYSSDGRLLAAGSSDHTLLVIEAATGKLLSKMEMPGLVGAVAFSPDARYLAAGSHDGTLRIFEPAMGLPIHKMDFRAQANAISLSKDGRSFAAGGADGVLKIIDTASGREIASVALRALIVSISLSPDGSHAAIGCYDNTARVIETATGRQTCSIKFGNKVRLVRFSPDGRTFAAASDDHTIRLIEAESGRQLHSIELADGALSMDFSPDGKLLATGGWDKTARIIDPASGRVLNRTAMG
jgi:WD40 repeat protein